jgi:hypothetical protein
MKLSKQICLIPHPPSPSPSGSREAEGLRNTILLLLALLLNACGTYTFTGASIAPEIKTISIATFPNKAPLVNPTLSNEFSDKLKDKFIGQTTLNLVPSGGDLSIEGQIIDYRTQPVAIQGDETAALNRLTITINVKFTNSVEPTRSYETTFSRFAEYSSSTPLASVESALVNLINEALVEDIFNKAVVNW